MKKTVLLFLCCIFAAFCLAGCGNGSTTKEPEKKQVTLTFFNGDTELGKIVINAGEKATGYEKWETLEGYEFLGWYRTPSLMAASKRDLTTATFNEDARFFGFFKSTQVNADSRKWYIVGEGKSPVLKRSAWAGADVTDADRSGCELKATGNKTNEYSITLDLYAGDKFQIIHDWQWEDQKGYGRMKGLDAELFESGGGLSGDANTSNVGVLKDGNYTIILTTDPDAPVTDAVVIIRNGDAAPAPVDDTPAYVPGENTRAVMKGSWVADWSENVDLTRKEGTNTFSITKEFAAGIEIYIMLWDGEKDTGIGFNASSVDEASKALLEENYNIKFKEAGTYTITVDADKLTVTVTK